MESNIAYKNEWVVEENRFLEDNLSKFESIMAQGNGYLECRNSLEEMYKTTKRGMFVAGVFNQFSKNEVPELVNLPDLFDIVIKINGERFDLKAGEVHSYTRQIDYATGETLRKIIWQAPSGITINITFSRFVSMDNKHLILNHIQLSANQNCSIEIISGIDGTVSNSGSQHLEEGEKRLYDNKYLNIHTTTTFSKVPINIGCFHEVNKEGTRNVRIGRRRIFEKIGVTVSKDEVLTFTKYALVYTGRDKEWETLLDEDKLKKQALETLKNYQNIHYETLRKDSATKWQEILNTGFIQIDSSNFKDQLLLNFARYHIHSMSPVHDERMNIGAKGMTGEGYKGHCFWDTEVFLLPYFIYHFPDSAKNLVKYRMNSLAAAKKNAILNGFTGAQFPWEAAWITDGETTPEFGDIDIITGEANPILTGILEHHVTADVVKGAVNYLEVANDTDFKKDLFEMLLACGMFWTSRVSYNEKQDRYEILDVIGPDEYKEHIDNNAYTNYLVKYTLETVLKYAEDIFAKELTEPQRKCLQEIEKVNEKLYIPKPNHKGVIPQDDNFLEKKIIDLQKYFSSNKVGTLFEDYNFEQVNQIQVIKQADVLLLLWLFKEDWSKEVIEKNWDYYYPLTLHDSSLSMSTHANLAVYLEKVTDAYELFKKTFDIDLGAKDMHSSDEGIHAASLGGIWQNVVMGFGGISIHNDTLYINPKLPTEWQKLVIQLVWQNNTIRIKMNKDSVQLKCEGKLSRNLKVNVNGEIFALSETIKTNY